MAECRIETELRQGSVSLIATVTTIPGSDGGLFQVDERGMGERKREYSHNSSSSLSSSSSSSSSTTSTSSFTSEKSQHHYHHHHHHHGHQLTCLPWRCHRWQVSGETGSRRRSRPTHWSSWRVLSSYFCLLVLSTTTTTTMAAPSGNPPPKWVNPCGVDPSKVIDSQETVSIPSLKHSELYSNIALQAKLAKEQAEKVSPQFVMDAFKDANFPDYSKDLSYKWLPQIPNAEKFLADENEIKALKQSYEFLQYYAVGIEQILQDQILYDGTFLDDFRTMEGKLRQVLCELQLAMIEMTIPPERDIQRAVMKQEYRDMDSKTARDLRDWIILRDYIAALDFISSVFEDYKNKAEQMGN